MCELWSAGGKCTPIVSRHWGSALALVDHGHYHQTSVYLLVVQYTHHMH